MSADLTCRTCNAPRVFCSGCGRTIPSRAEWDALKAERDRYREALGRITGQGPAARKAYENGRGVPATLPYAQHIARTALDGEPTDE